MPQFIPGQSIWLSILFNLTPIFLSLILALLLEILVRKYSEKNHNFLLFLMVLFSLYLFVGILVLFFPIYPIFFIAYFMYARFVQGYFILGFIIFQFYIINLLNKVYGLYKYELEKKQPKRTVVKPVEIVSKTPQDPKIPDPKIPVLRFELRIFYGLLLLIQLAAIIFYPPQFDTAKSILVNLLEFATPLSFTLFLSFVLEIFFRANLKGDRKYLLNPIVLLGCYFIVGAVEVVQPITPVSTLLYSNIINNGFKNILWFFLVIELYLIINFLLKYKGKTGWKQLEKSINNPVPESTSNRGVIEKLMGSLEVELRKLGIFNSSLPIAQRFTYIMVLGALLYFTILGIVVFIYVAFVSLGYVFEFVFFLADIFIVRNIGYFLLLLIYIWTIGHLMLFISRLTKRRRLRIIQNRGIN